MRHGHRFRAGAWDRAGGQAALAPAHAALTAILDDGATAAQPVAQSLCRGLQKLEPARWTFATLPGVAPTHHAAAPALRPAVRWRKRGFGTQRATGSRFVARILTVTATGRKQRHRRFALLVDALTAAQRGHPQPSLLPTPERLPFTKAEGSINDRAGVVKEWQ